MATLEKIRSKSVLLIIVIGVALLAFIIGDAITNSRNIFGDQSTVAKIGGKKIDYTDYIHKREELNNQVEQGRRQNPQQYANFDAQVISQAALDQLIGEALLDEAAENAGIQVSPSQLTYYVLQNPVSPRIREILQQLNAAGHGVATPTQAYEIIFNPVRNGLTEAEMAPYQRAWVAMEQETAQLIRRNTYQRLLMGSVKANNLDKKALYNDYIDTRSIEFAFIPYVKADFEAMEVDDASIHAEYDNVKGRYKVEEPTKEVAFIAVNITPSEADRAAATRLAQETAKALRDSAGQVGKDLRKEGIAPTRKELRLADIPRGAVKDFVTTAPVDSVKIVQQNIKGFTVVKMGKKSQVVDSLQINIIQVAGETLANRVLPALNSGLPLDSLSNVFAADSVLVQKDQWIALYNAQGRTGAMDDEQYDALVNANGEYVSLVSTPQFAVLGNLIKKNAPVEVYEYDEVTYDLKPSTTTVNDERTRLEEFLAANTTMKEFVENAPKDGYAIRNVALTSSSAAVPRTPNGQSFFPDSRQVVRWVMIDGKPGQVSHVYESKDAMTPALYAAAIVSEYEDYVPLNNDEVNAAVKERVQKSKLGDKKVEELQPKASNMASASQAMGVESRNNGSFRFGRNSQIRDAAIMGRIAGSQPGNVVLVKGDDGVYAYQVLSTNTETFPYTDNQYEQQYFRMINPDLGKMLKGAKEYKNNIYKFEAGD